MIAINIPQTTASVATTERVPTRTEEKFIGKGIILIQRIARFLISLNLEPEVLR